MGLERGPLSLVSTIEEKLGRNSSDSGLENREYDLGDTLLWPRNTLYPQKLALTSPTSGGRSVCIVRCLSSKFNCYIKFEAGFLLCYHDLAGKCMVLEIESRISPPGDHQDVENNLKHSWIHTLLGKPAVQWDSCMDTFANCSYGRRNISRYFSSLQEHITAYCACRKI
jgi:hypothetical protein